MIESKQWFLTGSRVYGPITHESDIDIACLDIIKEQIFEIINKNFIIVTTVKNNYNNGVKFNTHEKVTINIIPLLYRDYFKWSRATKMMKCLPPILDRNIRYHIFESLCGISSFDGTPADFIPSNIIEITQDGQILIGV